MRERKSMMFKRGQIWWLKKDSNEVSPHIMDAKDRYYLIVSCDLNNAKAPIANVLVISSKENDHLPIHIPFFMPSGKKSIIECEQIYTKSITKFQEGYYEGVVSDEVMKEVDRALTNQLGIKAEIPGIEAVTELVEELVAKRIKQVNPKGISDDMVLSVCKKISDMFDQVSPVESKPVDFVKESPVGKNLLESEKEETKPETKGSLFKPYYEKYVETKPSNVKPTFIKPEVSEIPTKEMDKPFKRPRAKWTEEKKKQFLDDCDAMSPRKVMEKYNLKNLQSVYQKKYLITSGK